jgi:hypothetical protein
VHLQANHFLCPICTPAEASWMKTQRGWYNHITRKHRELSERRRLVR